MRAHLGVGMVGVGGSQRTNAPARAAPAKTAPALQENLPAAGPLVSWTGVAPPEVSKNLRRAATERFFDRIGLRADAPLDRKVVDRILGDYFALALPKDSDEPTRHTKRAAMIRDHLEEAITEKGSLGAAISGVKCDLVERHTPLSQLLALADLDGVTSNPKVQATAKQVAHHAFVLDALVGLLIDDADFSKEVRRHFYHQRSAKGITLGRIRKLAGTFGAVKAATIDMVFRPALGMVLGLERTRSWGKLGTLDFLAWSKSGVPLNITEAMVTEAMGAAYDNALAGFRLAATTASGGRIGGDKKELLLDYPKGWTELYESWNLLFVFSNLEDPDLLIAKLLIPSLTSAESEQYIYRRTLALWVTIQTYLFLKDQGVPPANLGIDPAQADAIKKLWGSINRQYSTKLGAQPSEEPAKRKQRSIF